MRRFFAAALLALSGLAGAGAAADHAATALPTSVPLVPSSCTPDPAPFDAPKPAGCQRILYKYGPIHITPGDNLILLGPVTIEKPLVDGYMIRFKPDLVRADDSVPPVDILHLHHAVWISTAFDYPLFASGEEKTIFNLPPGYGIPVKGQSEAWLLNYMLHNQTPVPENVFITYEIDFVPKTAVAPGSMTHVEPLWLDVGNFNGFNPVYNTQRGFGSTPGECSFPKEQCANFDPYGKLVTGQGKPGNGVGERVGQLPTGTIVWGVGHVHPGGLRLEVDLRRNGVNRRVFQSDAVYFDPNGPVSWDMSMEVTHPSWRLGIKAGDELVVNSIYETSRASWYEGMGIVVVFIAPGDTSGPDPFANPGSVDPHNATITHGHLPEAGNYGGDGAEPFATPPALDVDKVAIAGFANLPGNFGTYGYGVPTVAPGEKVTFANADAAAQVFHTVTACAYPCNGTPGISYPLADGAVDFDSLELGVGPPIITAASNRVTYALDTAGMSSGTYTYFCRVHPFMRGAFRVE